MWDTTCTTAQGPHLSFKPRGDRRNKEGVSGSCKKQEGFFVDQNEETPSLGMAKMEKSLSFSSSARVKPASLPDLVYTGTCFSSFAVQKEEEELGQAGSDFLCFGDIILFARLGVFCFLDRKRERLSPASGPTGGLASFHLLRREKEGERERERESFAPLSKSTWRMCVRSEGVKAKKQRG